jgi:hypothetical protein
MEGTITFALTRELSAQIGKGANKLPATVKFDEGEGQMLMASLLPPPEQKVDFGKG